MEDIQNVKMRFGIFGNSPLLHNALRVAVQVAPTDMTVLIQGESGTGKESFSKIIHQLSPRKHNNFIAINCGAIPEGTIDSELFGHEKGAFSGAHESRKGYFEVTDGGTIFLDEIGEMPLGTQARLLRVLEYGEYIRVGSSKVLKTNVRVVSATNVNLLSAVEKGKFREDLYYRLATVPLYVPPLRERKGDISLLFTKFSMDFAEKYLRKPVELNEEALEHLSHFQFPGNVRQLRNIVEQLSVLESTAKPITLDTLQKYLHVGGQNRLPAIVDRQSPGPSTDQYSDRDLLYKILFELKRDVAEMKAVLMSGKWSESVHSSAPINKTSALLPESSYGSSTSEQTSFVINTAQSARSVPTTIDLSRIEDITPEDDSSLSLEKNEKEMIVRALKKNNNKRKYAAMDLGISERTLYRKIKQYELDALTF